MKQQYSMNDMINIPVVKYIFITYIHEHVITCKFMLHLYKDYSIQGVYNILCQ